MRAPHRRWLFASARAVGVCGFLASTACQGDYETAVAPEITPALMASIVTGAAKSNLDASGHFRLKGPPASGPRQLRQEQAEALAAIWPQQFGTWTRSVFERQHGGSINFAGLKLCGRTLYAESPLEPFDPKIAGDPFGAVSQRVFGPWWLTTLCTPSGTPQLSLAVSAYATDLWIEEGRIRGPVVGGEWFSPEGIPLGADEEFILSPERAAERVATRAKRRIREVPRLLVPLRRQGFPNHPYWKLMLDSLVDVQPEQGGALKKRDVYIGRRPTDRSNTLAIAAKDQPDELPISYPLKLNPETSRAPRQHGVVRVKRKADLPISFQVVTMPPRGEP